MPTKTSFENSTLEAKLQILLSYIGSALKNKNDDYLITLYSDIEKALFNYQNRHFDGIIRDTEEDDPGDE